MNSDYFIIVFGIFSLAFVNNKLAVAFYSNDDYNLCYYIYMQIESTILEFKNTGNFSTEYIESLLTQNNKLPLRWAIVDVNDNYFKVSIAKIS